MATPESDDVTADNNSAPAASNIKSKPNKGVFSRIRNFQFRGGKEDSEKVLENLSKEEAVVSARLRRRSKQWEKFTHIFIMGATILQGIAMAFIGMTIMNQEPQWRMWTLGVLLLFGLAAFAGCLFYSCSRLFKRFERNDQKTFEKLRVEVNAKIELKERNNFYTILQQLQRYDPDPATRDFAARMLASETGEERVFTVTLRSDSGAADSLGEIHDAQDELMPQARIIEFPEQGEAGERGWMSRIADILAGLDPSQFHALICGNCHMHNGLARKYALPYVAYYCPHCGTVNGSRGLSTIVRITGRIMAF